MKKENKVSSIYLLRLFAAITFVIIFTASFIQPSVAISAKSDPSAQPAIAVLAIDSNNAESKESDNTYEQSLPQDTSVSSGLNLTQIDPPSQPEAPVAEVGEPPLPAGITLVPPSPDLLTKLKREGYSSVTILDMTKSPPQLDVPQVLNSPVLGIKKALVLLVDFPDMRMNAVSQPSFYNNLLFSDGTFAAPGSMRDYYQTNSYNQFDVQGTTANCVLAPNNSDYYAKYDGVHNKGKGPYPTNAQGLVVHTVQAADSFINFADYAVSGTVQGLFVIHAGAGAETNYPSNLIWSHSWSLGDTSKGSPGPLDVDGVHVNAYTMEPEFYSSAGDSTIGVFTHEYAHALGLPDLYDYGYDSKGIGTWSLMAGGSWNGRNGSSPANLDAWSKIRLGWLNPTIAAPNLTGVTIPPSNSSATAYKLLLNGNAASQYFLLENRQKVGFDAALPGSGLLIWHIDDNVNNNDNQCTQINNWLCSSHFKVALEQADGLYQLENNTSGGDAGDPFPGSTTNRTFNFTTTPNSSSYSSSTDTLVRVTNITTSGSNIVADLSGNSSSVPNDDFGSPYIISTTSYTRTQDVSNATTAGDDPSFKCVTGQKNRTVWYRYTPSVNGILTVNTIGSNYDTVLGVWTGSRGSLASVECDDDTSRTQSSITISATAGTAYYIEVAAYGSSDATPSLNLNFSFTAGNLPCYTLTKVVSPSGVGYVSVNHAPNCVGDATKYISGTMMRLYAGAYSSYVFSNWSGDASGVSSSTTITMNGNKSVTANFNDGLWIHEFGYVAGGWRVDRHPRVMGDVNGDGKEDVVGFGDNAVFVSLSTGTSFSPLVLAYREFGYIAGGWRVEQHPRMVADVNGDKKVDLVGFGNTGVWVALNTSTGSTISFGTMTKWINEFGYSMGGWLVERHPRTLADVNGDGKADVIGFGDNGVYVALSNGSSFGTIQKWSNEFGYISGGWRVEQHPRLVADMNNDGKADLVGFGNSYVYVALSNGSGFGPSSKWLNEFGYIAGGWRVERNPRTSLLNRSSCGYIVGFGEMGVYAASSNCNNGFYSIFQMVSGAFGSSTAAGGWMVNQHPRMTADVDGNGVGEIIGFGNGGVYVKPIYSAADPALPKEIGDSDENRLISK